MEVAPLDNPSVPNAPKSAPKNPPKKRPRATLEQKIQILDHYHGLDHTQLETVARFQHDVAILTLTFHEWLKNEPEYRRRYRALGPPSEKHARRKATYKYAQINRAMDLLVQQRLAQGAAVTEPVLRDYWQVYAHQFGVENPKRLVGFSHGWLAQFKKRHGLCRPRAKGPSGAQGLTTRNERLLVSPDVPEAREPQKPVEPSAEHDSPLDPQPPREDQGSQGLFRPQQTLSFPPALSYLSPGVLRELQSERVQAAPLQRHDRVHGDELPAALEQAMRLASASRPPIAAQHLERLLTDVADRFFQDHQYDYPQTLQLYEAFKASFASELLICLRSAQERRRRPPLEPAMLDEIFLPQDKRAYDDEEWPSSVPRSLWEQNKLMLS